MTPFKLGIFSCLLLLASASTVFADAPAVIPLQGFLADRDGEPVEGPHRLTFILYDAESDGAALYTDDRRSVEIDRGQFWVYLGSDDGAPLDLALFREHGELWLEVTIDGKDVIQPRIALGSVPYAAFAQSCGEAATLGGLSAADVSSSYVDADGDTMSGALSVQADLSATGNVTVGGKIVSGKFGQDSMTLAGALPLDFTFTTGGGTLLVMVSGSAYSATGGGIGATVSLDGTGLGTLFTYTNEAGSHKAFPAQSFVVQRPAGSHTVSFAAVAGTLTDGNDPFYVTVLELPF
jgi:hypothetical protein